MSRKEKKKISRPFPDRARRPHHVASLAMVWLGRYMTLLGLGSEHQLTHQRHIAAVRAVRTDVTRYLQCNELWTVAMYIHI